MPRVAIIGGGWAGLAAGVELTRANIEVCVFESVKELGGRARRVTHQNENLDNGIHLLSGAYSETINLISSTLTNKTNQLTFNRRPFEFTHEELSIKRNLYQGPGKELLQILGASGITWREKLKLLSLLNTIRDGKVDSKTQKTVLEFLRSNGQTEKLIELLWNPICLSALNTDSEEACATVFSNVIQDALLSGKNCSDFLFPNTDLTSVFPELAAAFIESGGGKVFLGKRGLAERPKLNQIKICGHNQTFTHLIIATSPHNVASSLQDPTIISKSTDIISELDYEPIYSIYHQYEPGTTTNAHMIGVRSEVAQWIFDRKLTHGQDGLIGVVISGSGSHQKLGHPELIRRSAQFLNSKFNFGAPQWSKVIAEKRATFRCTPNLKRPNQQTECDDIILAGDYTYERYPATLEAAVRSGLIAARLVIQKNETTDHI